MLNLFKRKLTLKKLQTEVIIREKSQLERELSTVNKQIQTSEFDKKELLLKGAKAASQAEKLGFAQQIKIKDFQVKALQKVQYPITQKLVVLNGLQVLKKNQDILERMQKGIFEKLDIDTVAANIDEIVVGQDVNFEKLFGLADVISSSMEDKKDVTTDTQVSEIMSLMDTIAQNPDKEIDAKAELEKVLGKPELVK